jgi:hypothetical protein
MRRAALALRLWDAVTRQKAPIIDENYPAAHGASQAILNDGAVPGTLWNYVRIKW